jgi:hypothetical protein
MLYGGAPCYLFGGSIFVGSFNKAWANSFTEFILLNMEHAEWAGFTFMDLIFPLFLFLVGLLM